MVIVRHLLAGLLNERCRSSALLRQQTRDSDVLNAYACLGLLSDVGQRALGQTRGRRAMMKRCNGSSRSKICSKDGTSTDGSSFVRELVHELQTELAGSGDHDGRTRHFRDAHNDSRR